MLKYYLNKARRDFKYFLFYKSQKKLKLLSEYKIQKDRYEKLKNEFLNNYLEIKKYDSNKFLNSSWLNFKEKIEKVMLPYPKFNFLSNPIILFTMFATAGGNWMRSQLKFLEERLNEKELYRLLVESPFGEPLILCEKYLTSHSSIQHLYSIERYFYKTNNKMEKIKSIIEWGGGYGNLAKIFIRKINKVITYIIIDIPIFSLIQYLYLSVILGEENVILLKSPDKKIVENKINILPLCFVESLNFNSDFFISTWALSESTKEAQDYVIENRNFFEAKYLLLANQRSDSSFKYAENLNRIANDKKAISEEISFLKGNYYHFI
jgi:hypothetical protein